MPVAARSGRRRSVPTRASRTRWLPPTSTCSSDADADAGEAATIAKYAAGEACIKALDHAIQTHGGTGYEGWLGGRPPQPPRTRVTPDDVVLQLYSSGTTGRPKGTRLTHAQRSGQNTPGYWRLPVETTNTLTPEGWLRTGDAAYRDAEGYLVVPTVGAAPDTEEIVAYARIRLAHYKCPTSVDVVDTLPRNAAGKVLKKVLRAPYWPA